MKLHDIQDINEIILKMLSTDDAAADLSNTFWNSFTQNLLSLHCSLMITDPHHLCCVGIRN